MTYTEPRPKTSCKLTPSKPLPIIKKSNGEIYKFKGVFNDYCVVVEDEEDMKHLISMGFFGKATLSRNYPQFKQHKPEIIRNRIYENRRNLSKKLKSNAEKVIVVPDSDSEENDNYFKNLKPLYQLDCSGIKENVHLSLEEAFFLAAAVECLEINYEDKKLKNEELWMMFQKSDKFFLQNYIVYYHFRSKNWVVKTGLKYGCDYLLYKYGPPFYHASYAVIIHIIDENLKKIEEFSRRSMKDVHINGLNRLCETAGKELLICEIIWPNSIEDLSFDDLTIFKIREIIVKRFIPSQEKNCNEPQASTSKD